jgi:hypothetical protein
MIAAIILLFISFSAYAIMWTLQFHFSESVFKNLNRYYWNPVYSWANKWKQEINTNNIRVIGLFEYYSNGKPKERFFGSSTFFVWLTDAFHLFQCIFLNSLILAFGFIADGKEAYGYTLHWWSAYLGIRIIYAVVFEGLFGWLLIKK